MKSSCSYVWALCVADLRSEWSLIVEQCLTERLLLTLVDVCKPKHLFFISWGKVQEGLVARKKGLVLSCDQQHTIPANHSLTSIWKAVMLVLLLECWNWTRKTPRSYNVLLSPSVKLLYGAQLIEKLLVDEPRHLQELVVGDKLLHNLSLHSSGLWDKESWRGRFLLGYTSLKFKASHNALV